MNPSPRSIFALPPPPRLLQSSAPRTRGAVGLGKRRKAGRDARGLEAWRGGLRARDSVRVLGKHGEHMAVAQMNVPKRNLGKLNQRLKPRNPSS